jgi:hypothetical protein
LEGICLEPLSSVLPFRELVVVGRRQKREGRAGWQKFEGESRKARYENRVTGYSL